MRAAIALLTALIGLIAILTPQPTPETHTVALAAAEGMPVATTEPVPEPGPLLIVIGKGKRPGTVLVDLPPLTETDACGAKKPDFGGHEVLTTGQLVSDVEEQIWDAFAAECQGHRFIRIARCEGLNAAAGWDPAFISTTGDAGIFQHNQIHNAKGELLEGVWPERVQTVEGAINNAVLLYLRDGLTAWQNSKHCWAKP